MKCRRPRVVVFRLVLVSAVVLMAGRCLIAADAVEPFNGKDVTGWKFQGDAAKSRWVVGTVRLKDGNPQGVEVTPGGTELVNDSKSVDIFTEAKFGDCLVELEVFVPKGSNSGIYLMGNYEIQIFDSFGKKEGDKHDMGAVYDKTAPKVNPVKAPGEWQKYVIDFRAPKFDAAGKKTANARFVKVTLNGEVIHENVEVVGTTGGPMGPEVATGPLRFQGDHGPVAFRNIKILPR
jgi:hypothetical protein